MNHKMAPEPGLIGATNTLEVTACARPLPEGGSCIWHAGHRGPCGPYQPPEFYDHMAATEPVKATMKRLAARLVPPARLGFRCGPHVVHISLYRSALHDEEGLYCAEGHVGYYDGEVRWYHPTPEDVLRPEASSNQREVSE